MKSRGHSGVRQWDLDVDRRTSRRLGQIRQHATSPELQLRSGLFASGYRYRVKNPDLPGRPDLANRTQRWAVFVHGCFWHQHPGCSRATIPKRNRSFWLEKFEANRQRDVSNVAALETIGFRVAVVWECEIESDLDAVLRRLSDQLPDPPRTSP